jgi:hypothetical protein
MDNTDRERPVLIFRYPWRRCWACEYHHIIMIFSNLIFTFQAYPPANIIFTGIGVLLLVRVFRRSLTRPILIP